MKRLQDKDIDAMIDKMLEQAPQHHVRINANILQLSYITRIFMLVNVAQYHTTKPVFLSNLQLKKGMTFNKRDLPTSTCVLSAIIVYLQNLKI